MNYLVRKRKIQRTAQLDMLARESGRLYSKVVSTHWKLVDRKGLWLSSASFQKFLKSPALHSQTSQAILQSFDSALKSWRKRRKEDPNAKPPWRKRRFYKLIYKSSAIRLKEGKLILSNGKGNDPLEIIWDHSIPKQVEIGWNGESYEIRAIYSADQVSSPQGERIAGIDLGEIHGAVAHDGEGTLLLNGRLLRSKRRYQNKVKARFDKKLSQKRKGSRRFNRLKRTKRKTLKRLDHQIKDILHQGTTRLISALHQRGAQRIVFGDVRDIRQENDKGPKVNQKIHQWLFGATRFQLSYKAERLGMETKLQEESYTSQDSPCCPKVRRKPKGRDYLCSCGNRHHRDAVGAFNVRKKYLEGIGLSVPPVVGAMASPEGIKYPFVARSR